jgi:hypothetical protein
MVSTDPLAFARAHKQVTQRYKLLYNRMDIVILQHKYQTECLLGGGILQILPNMGQPLGKGVVNSQSLNGSATAPRRLRRDSRQCRNCDYCIVGFVLLTIPIHRSQGGVLDDIFQRIPLLSSSARSTRTPYLDLNYDPSHPSVTSRLNRNHGQDYSDPGWVPFGTGCCPHVRLPRSPPRHPLTLTNVPQTLKKDPQYRQGLQGRLGLDLNPYVLEPCFGPRFASSPLLFSPR